MILGWIKYKIKGNSFNHRANEYYLADKKTTPPQDMEVLDHKNDGRAATKNVSELPLKQLTNKTNNNKTNKEYPVSTETENTSSDYPGTKWLLDLIVKEKLIKTEPPKADKELKTYKKWQAQLKELLKLGTKEEIVKALKRGVFYDNFKVSTPAGITNSLLTTILEIRQEKGS